MGETKTKTETDKKRDTRALIITETEIRDYMYEHVHSKSRLYQKFKIIFKLQYLLIITNGIFIVFQNYNVDL